MSYSQELWIALDLGSNLGLSSERPATNLLSHDTAFLEVTLCSVVGRACNFRWRYREDGDNTFHWSVGICGITSQHTISQLVYSDVSCSCRWYHCDSWRSHCILKSVELHWCLRHISEAILLLCFRSVFQCSCWSPASSKVRLHRAVKCLTWTARNVWSGCELWRCWRQLHLMAL